MPGGSEKIDTGGFALRHHPLDLTGGGGTYETINQPSYDFSIGDFNQEFPPIPPLPDFPEFPPFPEPGDTIVDNSGDTWVYVTEVNGAPLWLNITATIGEGFLPAWFDVHEEDAGDTHVVEIDEVEPANPLVWRLHGLPTSDPGNDGVWLSPT